MTIANVSLLNTFDQWRTITNQLVLIGNNITENNVIRATSNSLSLDITPRVNVGETLRINVTLSNSVTDSSVSNIPTAASVNTVYNYASIAHARANTINAAVISAYNQLNVTTDNVNFANIVAQLAFNKANAANVLAYNADIAVVAAFDRANSVWNFANTANLLAFRANVNAIAALVQSNSAFDRANIAIANVNYVNTAVQSAFLRANSSANTIANSTNTGAGWGGHVDRASSRRTLNFRNSPNILINVDDDSTLGFANVTVTANSVLPNISSQAGVTLTGNLIITGTTISDTRGGSVYDLRQASLSSPAGATSSNPSYTLSRSDAGRLINFSCATIQLPGGNIANPLQPGDIIRLYNANTSVGSKNANVQISAAANLWSSGNIAHLANESRNVWANSIITITCISANVFVAEGFANPPSPR